MNYESRRSRFFINVSFWTIRQREPILKTFSNFRTTVVSVVVFLTTDFQLCASCPCGIKFSVGPNFLQCLTRCKVQYLWYTKMKARHFRGTICKNYKLVCCLCVFLSKTTRGKNSKKQQVWEKRKKKLFQKVCTKKIWLNYESRRSRLFKIACA